MQAYDEYQEDVNHIIREIGSWYFAYYSRGRTHEMWKNEHAKQDCTQ